jgi:hypothetical protein
MLRRNGRPDSMSARRGHPSAGDTARRDTGFLPPDTGGEAICWRPIELAQSRAARLK